MERIAPLAMALLLTGCPEPEPDWSIPLEGGPGGMMLTAYSDGDELIFGGGMLDGTEGSLLRRSAAGDWCVEVVADRPVWWMHGAAEGTYYGVGERGLILRFDGGTITDESVATDANLFGVWDDGDRVWAVGGDVIANTGEIWVREGGVWSVWEDSIDGVVFKVWQDWFVGTGIAFQREGDELVDRTPEPPARLLTVRGRADDDVYAVGGDAFPVLLRWDGAAWTEMAVDVTCASGGLTGVWTAPGEDLWVTGMSGAMARFDGTDWACPDFAMTFDHFHAAWLHDGEAWFAGGDFFDNGDNHATLGIWGTSTVPAAIGACE